MVERATAFQTVQVGVESPPGTHVAANKKLLATQILPAVKTDIKTFKPLGTKFAAIAAQGKEWVEAKIEGMAAYNDLTYLLASIMKTPSFVQQGATIAYKSTYEILNAAPDTITTYSVEQGSSVRAHEFSYGLLNELTLEISRDECKVGGSMLGTGYADGATMTGTPTEIALQPVLPTEWSVYLADTYAGLPGTALTRVLSAGLKIGGRYNQMYVLNKTTPAAVAHVETVPEVTMTVKVEADVNGMALLTQLRSGASKFVRLFAEGPIIATTYKWTAQFDMCGKVTGISEFSDEDGVFAIEWTFTGAYDPTWGKALYAELINTLTAL